MKFLLTKRMARVLAVVLAAATLLSSGAIAASAIELSVGTEYDSIGTIVSNTTTEVADGLVYNMTTYTDTKGKGQTMYAMEFDPAATGYIPVAYQPQPSYGSQVKDAVAAAEAEGYEVLGAINGEFFSMASGNAGTLESRLITNGRIVADSENRNDVCLAIDSDGNFKLVKSQMAYRLYIDGKEVLNAEGGLPMIGTINKRYNGTNWWSPLMYFDYETGGATYSNADVKGVEVVFEKLNGTELMVEGTLQGKVVSVTENTYGTAMTENQFVLYAQNGSVNYNTLAKLTVGQEVAIFSDELNADAEEVMKNAVTVSAATYPIVVDGKNNTENTPNASDIYMTRAQRTAIGVKADGTMVFLCTKGRGASDTYDYGITLPQLTEMMIALGCEYAVNLDGGGSTTFYVDGKTKMTTGRAVASSILICKRNEATTSTEERDLLNDCIAEATAGSYATAEQAAAVQQAVEEAAAVYNDTDPKTGSMTGDFMRERMDLQAAMNAVSVAPKDGISLKAEDWSFDTSIMQATNDENGALVLNNTDGKWPWASYSCAVSVKADDKLYYDFTVAGQASIALIANGQEVSLNALIAPDSLDAGSGDILGGGKSFKGELNVSDILAGGFDLSAVMICAVGSAGDGSKVTVRHLGFEAPQTDDSTTESDGTTAATTTTTKPTTPSDTQSAPDTGEHSDVLVYVLAIGAAVAAVMLSTAAAKRRAR